jgi:acyl dehydratase
MNDMSFPPTLALRCGPVTAVDRALLAAASGDHNPLHLDANTARETGFDRPVVHGMFTVACASRPLARAFGAGTALASGMARVGPAEPRP